MYRVNFQHRVDEIVLVVGCGGTGGFVAEGLARILPPKYELVLQDHDRVEDRNLGRQNFFPADLGKFKSQALAERLAVNYRRPVGYKVLPFGFHKEGFFPAPSILIGCVDNANARRALSHETHGAWWIDAGNDHHSGQVLIGNATPGLIKHSFSEHKKKATYVPLPSVQVPALMAASAPPKLDCATAVEQEEQSPVINQMMATLVLQMVHKLIKDELDYMGAYIDLETGTLKYVRIEISTVARICDMKPETLKE